MTRRDRLMLMAVLGVVLLMVFWFMVLSPQRKKASDAESKLAVAQQAFAAAQQKLTAGRQAQDEFRRDRTTILKLGRVVPETDDIPTLLTQLQALADKNDVIFHDYSVNAGGGGGGAASTAVTGTTPAAGAAATTGTGSTAAVAPLFPPGSIQVNGGLGRTPIELVLQGTYKDLEKYLRAVQRFAVISGEHSSTTGRLLVVDGFGYAFSTDRPDAKIKNVWEPHPDLTATLAASVYFAPPLETPSASAAAAGAAGAVAPTTPAGTSTSTGTAAIGGLR